MPCRKRRRAPLFFGGIPSIPLDEPRGRMLVCARVRQNPPAGGEPKTPLDAVMRFSSSADMEKYFKNRDKRLPVERISSVENQYLLANSLRMFSGMRFEDIGRLQLDIEVHSDEGFPQAGRPNDRIIAVGLSGRGGKKILEISEMSDAAEKKLLTDLQRKF